jgi:hypothetical protein
MWGPVPMPIDVEAIGGRLEPGVKLHGDHGRIETRQAFVCGEIDWLRDHQWPGLAAIGSVNIASTQRISELI